MKISGFHFNSATSMQRGGAPASGAKPAPASGDSVQLSGINSQAIEEQAVKRPAANGKSLGKTAAKVAIIAGGLLVGGCTALGVGTIAGSLGLASFSLGFLATLSKNDKIKTAGYMMMLGPAIAAGGVLGAIGSGLQVGLGVGLTAQYGAEAHKLANQFLDR